MKRKRKQCDVCHIVIREGWTLERIDGDGVVSSRQEVLSGDIEACHTCAEEIRLARKEAQINFNNSWKVS